MVNVTVPSPSIASRHQLLDVRVRAVAAHALGVEQADAEDEVRDPLRRAHVQAERHALAGVEDVGGLAVVAGQRHLGDLDLARAPATLGGTEHVVRLPCGVHGALRKLGGGVGGRCGLGGPPSPRVGGRELLLLGLLDGGDVGTNDAARITRGADLAAVQPHAPRRRTAR